jgi:hypothetical protein
MQKTELSFGWKETCDIAEAGKGLKKARGFGCFSQFQKKQPDSGSDPCVIKYFESGENVIQTKC